MWIIPALALGALVVPIQDLGLSHGGLPMIGVFAVALACGWVGVYFLSDVQHARTYANTTVAILAVVLLFAVFGRPIEHAVNVAQLGIQSSQLSSTAWALYQSALIAANNTVHDRVYTFFVRLPLWLSLIVVMIFIARQGLRAQSASEDDTGSPAAQRTYA